MAIIGGILLIVGIVLFFVRRSQLNRLDCLRSARLSTTSDIQQIASAVATDIGAGSWQDYVKVYGKVACDTPIHSQVKKVACAYTTTKVTREYETVETSRDKNGKRKTETKRRSEVVSQNKQSTPFWLVDTCGKIEVCPEDADIETVEILSEFRPETQRSGKISFGGFSLSTNTHRSGKGRTLGYKYEESILPLDREVLIVGMATDATSRITIRKPSENKRQFIISLKTEGELTRGVSRHAKHALYAMIGCLGVGTTLVAIELLSGA